MTKKAIMLFISLVLCLLSITSCQGLSHTGTGADETADVTEDESGFDLWEFLHYAKIARGYVRDTIDPDGEILKEVGAELVDALINKDIDALKAVMAPTAVATEDFQKGFDYACSIINEEIVSIEFYYPKDSSLREHRVLKTGTYWLTTASGRRIGVGYDYCYDDADTDDNIGVYSLDVGDESSAKCETYYAMYRAGIFHPDWNDIED